MKLRLATLFTIVLVSVLGARPVRATTIRAGSGYGAPPTPLTANTPTNPTSIASGVTEELICPTADIVSDGVCTTASGSDFAVLLLTLDSSISGGTAVTVSLDSTDGATLPSGDSAPANLVCYNGLAFGSGLTPWISSTDCTGNSSSLSSLEAACFNQLNLQTPSSSSVTFTAPDCAGGTTIAIDETGQYLADVSLGTSGAVGTPEPSTLLLLASGLFGLALLRRRALA